MKILLLFPKRYSFFQSFEKIFARWNAEVHLIDFQEIVAGWEKKVNTQIFRLPDSLRRKWETQYLGKINQHYREEFERLQPDLVLIYNDSLLLPDTLQQFKEKGAKIAFFLGDNPLYTVHNRYSLTLLSYADTILSPDSFWSQQLRKMGLKNIHYFILGIPSDQYYPVSLSPERYEELKTEVLYLGMAYKNSWGYKKTKFMSHFSGFDLKIIGDRSWERWLPFFPELYDHFQLRTGYTPTEVVNELYNATKIIPVDGNPGIFNGLHLRVYEALGAGALPLMEWQDDLKEIFGTDAELPAVRSYEEIPAMTAFYLENEDKRRTTVEWMRNTLMEKYSIEQNGALLQKALRLDPVHT